MMKMQNAEDAARDPLAYWTDDEVQSLFDFFAADVGDDVFAIVGYWVDENFKENAVGCFVASRKLGKIWIPWCLFVNPNYRRKGFGAQLVRVGFEQMKLRGATRIEFSTSSPELLEAMRSRGMPIDQPAAYAYRMEL